MLLREGKKSQALRCLRGRKRVEKRAENLQAKLESIRGILDRIAQSQTDKMVRDEADTAAHRQLNACEPAGGAGVSGRGVGAEALPEGRDGGRSREAGGSNPGGDLSFSTFRLVSFRM